MLRSVFFFIAVLVLVADQLSKWWVVTALSPYGSEQLIPNILYFTRTTNTGAAFGVFPHATLELAALAVAAVAGISYYAAKSSWPINPAYGLGLALPLGGALGNLLDRIRLGHVVDFIEVHIGSYVWPIFNVADSAICVGVGVLVTLAIQNPAPRAPAHEKTHLLP